MATTTQRDSTVIDRRYRRLIRFICGNILFGLRRLSAPFGILRKIVGDCVPRSAAVDKGVKLRPNLGVIVESSHANRYLVAVRPVAAKQAGTAVHTECFHSAFAFSINFNQLFALEETELFLQHPRLRAHGRPRMFAAAVAMTVIGLEERRIDFKTHATTQAAATDGLSHGKV